ncbi:MAG: hypothetical protein U5K79_05685 [Cyclobacteriaceae bacterium]|nr:hypothetical protein [Cyclobacteriaceae bacterium]
MEAIGKSIASSFNSGKINETTKRLLEETQEKAEQMKAQEEELRQNMEELRRHSGTDRTTKQRDGGSPESIV